MQRRTIINGHYWLSEATLTRPLAMNSEREEVLPEPLGHSDDTKDEGLIRNVTARVEEPDRRVRP